MTPAIHIVKFVHIACVMLLFGSLLFSYLLVCLGARRKGAELCVQDVRFSLFLDRCAFGFIVVLFATGSVLVKPTHYTFSTPWINVAFTLLTLLALLLLYVFYFKKKRLASAPRLGLMHISYGVILIGLVLIMHDAVFRHTLWG